MNTKEMAEQFCVSERTARRHIARGTTPDRRRKVGADGKTYPGSRDSYAHCSRPQQAYGPLHRDLTMTVVTTHYRYKRPPRTRKVVALEVPGIVRTKQPRGTLGAQPETVGTQPIRTIARGNATLIVTVRKTGKRFADVPDLTPEEHQRRGDAADAMWRELVWRVAGKDRSD